ncbi:MAG: 4Fe-4S dicluster domain-containing protein [Actinomycetaceae bacterium]|nr:4Fe-4S dicluster domain-containing protein [Actinomycetaceae bacterium]
MVDSAYVSAGLLRWVRDEEPDLTLICESADRAYSRSTVPLRVAGCVADSSIVLAPLLLACGASGLQVDVESCACGGEGRARARFEAWRGMLGDRIGEFSQKPPRFRAAEVVDAASAPVSRRALFGMSSDLSLPVDLDATEHVQLVSALEVLGIDAVAADGFAGAPRALNLSVDGCTACGVCVAACPNDAFSLTTSTVDGADVSVLAHDRGACTGSGECVRLCPEEAITVGDAPSWAELGAVEVARVYTARCRKCRALFVDDGSELCLTCRRVASDPFGSWLPPGFERK